MNASIKGNGPAKNLQLKCEIAVPESVDEKGMLTIYTISPESDGYVEDLESELSPLVTNNSEYSGGSDGAILSENEGSSSFVSALEFSEVTSVSNSVKSKRLMSFEDVIEYLEQAGHKNYHLELSLYYENILGESESFSFFDCWGDTETNFASTIQQAKGETEAKELL